MFSKYTCSYCQVFHNQSTYIDPALRSALMSLGRFKLNSGQETDGNDVDKLEGFILPVIQNSWRCFCIYKNAWESFLLKLSGTKLMVYNIKCWGTYVCFTCFYVFENICIRFDKSHYP